MTHVQRIRAIARLASVTENEATFMDEFITEECPSLLEVCTSKIAILDFGVIVPDCLQVWGGGGGGGGRGEFEYSFVTGIKQQFCPRFCTLLSSCYHHVPPPQLKVLYETLV